MTRTDLPAMDPGFVAASIEALPSRLQKRLDKAEPDSWTVDGTTVHVGTATVTLSPPDGAECDCLLSPRCLHVAQALVACPAGESAPAAETAAAGADDNGTTDSNEQASPAGADAPPRLTEDQLTVLELAESCLTGLLDRGLAGLTAADRAAVLRVVSAARVQRLPLLAAEFAIVHGRLGERVTEAAISALVGAALATQRLRHGHETDTLSADAIGTARRSYQPVGNLRLRGWASEPLLTSSGYAGVITYLVDEKDGRVWTLSSVQPGDDTQVTQTYNSGVDVGDLGVSHRTLARSGVLLTNATASADGRLGRGRDVRASMRTPDETATPAEGWWWGEAALGGVEDDGLHPVLVLHTDEGTMRCQVVTAAEELGLRALRVLASAPGAQVQVRLRARTAVEPGRSQWVLIAVGHDDTWIFPGLDRPEVHWLGAPRDVAPKPITSSVVDPAAVLRRWRDAVARQGRRAVSGSSRTRLMADAEWLRSHASGRRATLLEQLADAASAGDIAFDGRFHADPRDLPRRWVAIAAVC